MTFEEGQIIQYRSYPEAPYATELTVVQVNEKSIKVKDRKYFTHIPLSGIIKMDSGEYTLKKWFRKRVQKSKDTYQWAVLL